MRSWPAPDVPSVPGYGPALRLYDSASGDVRPTHPGPVASLYVCGITPYDATHLGHAATYLAFDLVHRYWRDGGHDVHYVQNITDIDDPLLERAERDGIDWRDLAEREIELFRTDLTALRVLPPRDYIGAVEAMDEVSAAVAELLASGAAYAVDDADFPDVYFDVTSTGRFGYESRYGRPTMLEFAAERGGDPERPGKRDPLDPVLWRTARPGEPSWGSPVGDGRPGWHIECAVIAGNRLGATIDVQGGGSDLIFPHHECSAAHAEVLRGVERFARHYTHAGMIGLDGEKMSKSRGNLVLVSALREAGVDPMAVRLALLSGHYRTDRSWSDDLLTQAQERLVAWRTAAATVAAGPGAPAIDAAATEPSGPVRALRAALADDLDTPAALAVVDAWAADPDRSPDVPAAVDALLGIDLRPVSTSPAAPF